jgi:hypothetical protein
MSNFYNPDYPVSNPGGFIQHTYRPDQSTNNMFWYGGVGAFNASTIPADSRRNDGMAMYAMPQFPQSMPTMMPSTNMPITPTTNPVGNGMPFSSYPNNQQNAQPAFNSLVESRRFAPTPQVDVSSNPWATQNQPVQPQFPVSQPTPQCVNVPNPWMYAGNINYNDPNCTALYSNTNFGFDKGTGAWDNSCVPQKTIIPPAINWGQPVQPQYQQPTFASMSFNYPQTQTSWKDTADRNWGSGSF